MNKPYESKSRIRAYLNIPICAVVVLSLIGVQPTRGAALSVNTEIEVNGAPTLYSPSKSSLGAEQQTRKQQEPEREDDEQDEHDDDQNRPTAVNTSQAQRQEDSDDTASEFDEDSTNEEEDTDSELETIKHQGLSVQAREVRGWDQEKKIQFMEEAKAWAEVKSGQDLEHFAQGVLLSDETIESLSINFDAIKAKHKRKAKLLGVFNSSIDQETTIIFGDGEYGRTPQEVKVKYPWYRFLYSVGSEVSGETIEHTLETDLLAQPISSNADDPNPSEMSVYARVLGLLITSFKGN